MHISRYVEPYLEDQFSYFLHFFAAIKYVSSLSVKSETMATIDPFTTKTNSDCDPNPNPPSIHTIANITTVTESENRVGTSVEVPSTPLRV